MTGKKHEKPLHLDMPFEEALERLAQTEPREMPDPKKRKKKPTSPVISETAEIRGRQRRPPKLQT